MKLPYWLLRLLPKWDCICPKCKREVTRKSRKCPFCGENYGVPLRVPPKILENPKALEDYVHTHVFPKISAWQREYLASFFSTMFASGFEGGNFGEWTGTSVSSGQSLTVQSSVKHHGSYGAYMDYDGTGAAPRNCRCYKTFTRGKGPYYARAYVYVDALSTNGRVAVLGLMDSVSSTYSAVVTLTSSLNIEFYWRDNAGEHSATSSTSLSLDTWYCLEVNYYCHASAGEARVWLNGTEVSDVSKTGLANDTRYADRMDCGSNYVSYTTTGTADIYFDCAVLADAHIGTEVANSETRYMRSDTHTVNGLTKYVLGTTQTESYLTRSEYAVNSGDWGIRVWKRASGGTETEITSGTPVAQVSRTTDGSGIQTNTWACPETTLASTDAIVVKVYVRPDGGSWVEKETFITTQLSASKLDAATWLVSYWTQLDTTNEYAAFRFGSTSYNSQIGNFKYTAGVILKELSDSIGLSDSLLHDKTLSISDFAELTDTPLRDSTLQISDMLVLSDSVQRDRGFSVFDTVSLSDLVDVITEIVKHVLDSIAVSETLSLDKDFLLMDQIQITESLYINKILITSDQILLAEIVEKAITGAFKTKIFLIIGDLAIQLTGE